MGTIAVYIMQHNMQSKSCKATKLSQERSASTVSTLMLGYLLNLLRPFQCICTTAIDMLDYWKTTIKSKFDMYKLPARVLGRAELCRLLAAVNDTRHPTRNRTMILLSFHAGLRACEIAGLTWPMVLGPSGKLTG